jgi:hypothetical protein
LPSKSVLKKAKLPEKLLLMLETDTVKKPSSVSTIFHPLSLLMGSIKEVENV